MNGNHEEPGAGSATAAPPPPSAPTPLRSRPLLHYMELSLGATNKKIKFTCIHASENFLACGASNGSVHLYARSIGRANDSNSSNGSLRMTFPGKYHLVKVISPPNNDRDRVGVSCLSICPLQKHLVVGTMRGIVYSLQLSDYHKIGEKVEFSHDFHAGFPITCFIWDKLGLRLFSACNGGAVCQTSFRAGMSAFFGSSDTELLLKEETGVVQLDLAKSGKNDLLLISSQLRVLLINLSSSEGSATPIGSKPRQGSYGACFFTAMSDDIDPAKAIETKMFCARPGRRLWIADSATGQVSSTLKFSVSKQPTAFLQRPDCELVEGIQMKDLMICKVGLFQFIQEPFMADAKVQTPYIVSWNSGSSAVFFLDPIAVEIVEWHLDLGVIHDLKVLNESIFVVLHGENRKVSIVQSCGARQFLDLYAGDGLKKSVQMAIEYSMNDALVLETLRVQWSKHTSAQHEDDSDSLSDKLNALVENAQALENRYRSAVAEHLTESKPLQVIFKQRPQQQAPSAADTPDLFASTIKNDDEAASTVTLKTNGALHRQVEYSDANLPPLEYSKCIYAPDGTTLEARLVDIKELSVGVAVVHADYKQAIMDEILQEIKRFEETKNEESINLLPTLKGTLNSKAAAKAFSTFLPTTNILSNLMDTSSGSGGVGRPSVSRMFGELPDFDDIVLDPVVPKPPIRRKEMYECPVLRIAMSSVNEDVVSTDTEVLLEAISMDIWDSKLKYASNLSITRQFNLPEETSEAPKQSANDKRQSETPRRMDASLPVQTKAQDKSAGLRITTDSIKSPPKKQLVRRSSLSPDPARAVQRAIQKHLGANPRCDVRRQCMVGGQMALSPEIEPVLKREIAELKAELNAAAVTAMKTTGLARRLWPASGITRVCACLTNVFLHQGDVSEARVTIQAWLNCFDPSAKVSQMSPTRKSPKGIQNKTGGHQAGWARGEALVDGDGLPLTRNDWNLVRTLVSTFFAISVAGSALRLESSANDPQDFMAYDTPYIYEMGVLLQFDPDANSVEQAEAAWTSSEATEFIGKYGIYLNTELAAEVCTLRRFAGALDLILDQVSSSSNMTDICDDIVNAVAEQKVDQALGLLRENDSLCLLLHVLDLLLKKCPEQAVALCVEKYPRISSWNIERCLFGNKMDLERQEHELLTPETMPQTFKYVRYLVRLLNQQSALVGRNAALVNRCIRLCFTLERNTIDNLFETNLVEWMARIFAQPNAFAFAHEESWKLLIEHRAVAALVELTLVSLQNSDTVHRGYEELDQLVTMIISDKAFALLERLFRRISAFGHQAEAIQTRVLEQLRARLSSEKHTEHLCASITHALMNAIGIPAAMKVLAAFPALVATIPLSIFHTMVESHVLSQRQAEEVHSMLETVDTHIWSSYRDASSRHCSFGPQATSIFNLERGSLRSVLDERKYEIWQSKCKQYDHESPWADGPQVMDDMLEDAPTGGTTTRFFEHRNGDWGGDVQLHDSVCAMCQLPVVIIAEDNCNLEISLLACGHAFHSSCLQDEDTCGVCLNANMKTLDYWSS